MQESVLFQAVEEASEQETLPLSMVWPSAYSYTELTTLMRLRTFEMLIEKASLG
jgi:hypothetical protein